MLTLYNTHWYLYMSELVEIVDSLENKISKLLHKIELLNKANQKLENELSVMTGRRDAIRDSLAEWEGILGRLVEQAPLLGSDTNKTEAKLRINALIRELDYCIVQLAE